MSSIHCNNTDYRWWEQSLPLHGRTQKSILKHRAMINKFKNKALITKFTDRPSREFLHHWTQAKCSRASGHDVICPCHEDTVLIRHIITYKLTSISRRKSSDKIVIQYNHYSHISRGSVVTTLECGGICNDQFISNFLLNLPAKRNGKFND